MFKFLDKISQWIPGKRERSRAKIREIRKKMDVLTQQKSTPDRNAKYAKLARELQKHEERLRDS